MACGLKAKHLKEFSSELNPFSQFTMLETLPEILEIQELDMKMIRLMRVKNQHKDELAALKNRREELQGKVQGKETEVAEMKKAIRLLETEIGEVKTRIEKAEARQSTIKKVEEFNAVTQEINAAVRDKSRLETQGSEMTDKMVAEEELLASLKKELKESVGLFETQEKELHTQIEEINKEGKELLVERDRLAKEADSNLLAVYERLLFNKKDRVVVPIENRSCGGCHIQLTPQHENLVRRGERAVFCEHCSRLHYWKEETATDEGTTTKRRRRKVAV